MSFSMDVKEELASRELSARHCQLAWLLAVTLSCGSLCEGENGYKLIYFSENTLVLRKCFTFLQKTFSIICKWENHRNGMCLEVREADAVDRILSALKLDKAEGNFDSIAADRRILARKCCRQTFISGYFLTAGSITAPQKSYHFEIVTPSVTRAAQIQEIICSFEIDAKIVVRKGHQVVYVKEGDQIAKLLCLIDATRALMAFENARALKELRNGVNRKVNCEAANISKTASAAVEQTRAIHYISEHYGLDNLPDALRETAYLRLERQEATLEELGRLMNPPVGKSGVNHRLRKLKELADRMKEGGRL